MDHVENYRLPKHLQENEENAHAPPDVSKPGLAYHGQGLASSYSLSRGQDLFAKPEVGVVKDGESKHDTDGDHDTEEDGSDGPVDDAVRRRKRSRKEKSRTEKERRKKGKKDSKEEKSRKEKKRRRRDSSDES